MVFSNRARFPKGVPDGVLQIANLVQNLKPELVTGEIPADLRVKWEALEHRIRTRKEARKAHLRRIQEKHGKSRRQVEAWGAIGLAVAGFLGARVIY